MVGVRPVACVILRALLLCGMEISFAEVEYGRWIYRTGIMGSRMAANLLRASHSLVVHNRTRSKADQLVADGAVWAETPADVGRQSSVLFTMLARPEAVLETALASTAS